MKRRYDPSPNYGVIRDHFGKGWIVSEQRETKHGFEINIGRRVALEGFAVRGGASIIITTPLKEYFDSIRNNVKSADLPISMSTICAIRKGLGHNHDKDANAFYRKRWSDLWSLSFLEFSEKHGVSIFAAQAARIRLMGRKFRGKGWHRSPEHASFILGAKTLSEIKEHYGVTKERACVMRSDLRRNPPCHIQTIGKQS